MEFVAAKLAAWVPEGTLNLGLENWTPEKPGTLHGALPRKGGLQRTDWKMLENPAGLPPSTRFHPPAVTNSVTHRSSGGSKKGAVEGTGQGKLKGLAWLLVLPAAQDCTTAGSPLGTGAAGGRGQALPPCLPRGPKRKARPAESRVSMVTLLMEMGGLATPSQA